jgi:hypothetical protein
MGEDRKVYRALGEKPEERRPFGRPMRRWEDGIRMESVDWIQSVQDRDQWQALVNTVMNLQVLAPRSYLVILSILKSYLTRSTVK